MLMQIRALRDSDPQRKTAWCRISGCRHVTGKPESVGALGFVASESIFVWPSSLPFSFSLVLNFRIFYACLTITWIYIFACFCVHLGINYWKSLCNLICFIFIISVNLVTFIHITSYFLHYGGLIAGEVWANWYNMPTSFCWTLSNPKYVVTSPWY